MTWLDEMPAAGVAELRDAGRVGGSRFDAPSARQCGNCGRTAIDLQPLDYGKRGKWPVCGDCLAKWRSAS